MTTILSQIVYLLSDSVDRAGSAEEFQCRTGTKLDNTNLLHSLPPVKLFKLFIMMILLLKWLSRPTSMLFKEAHHDHSGQYLMGSLTDTFTILVVIWE